MKTTLEYLEEAKNAKGIKSDNAFALSIGITRSSISNLKNNRNVMDDYTCIQIAAILEIDPMEIIAAANYERENVGVKKEFWLNFMMQYGRSTAAGAVLLGIISGGCLTHSESAKAAENQRVSSHTYYYQKFYHRHESGQSPPNPIKSDKINQVFIPLCFLQSKRVFHCWAQHLCGL